MAVTYDDLARLFSHKRVLLIGDTILDMFTYGTAMGLSAETPTIVARKKETVTTLGGAAFTCRNLCALGAHVDFLTLVGNDDEAAHVRAFAAPNLNVIAIEAASKPTTVKHRFWVDGYKLFQLDVRDDSAIGEDLAAQVMAKVEAVLPSSDLVIVSDYRHGFLTPALAGNLVEAVVKAGKPYYVDSQVAQQNANHTQYRHGAIMCLNLKEARCFDPGFVPSSDPASFAGLSRVLDTAKIVVKLGEQGAIMLSGERVFAAPALKANAVDTIGAGDAFLSALSLVGAESGVLALAVANAWAGLSVQIRGTEPPSLRDLPEAVAKVLSAEG